MFIFFLGESKNICIHLNDLREYQCLYVNGGCLLRNTFHSNLHKNIFGGDTRQRKGTRHFLFFFFSLFFYYYYKK